VAVGLFDAKGFAGTSMEEIAAGVGLTAGALYGHFRDKQSILDAVLDTATERQHQALESDRGADACGRLLELAERLVDLAVRDAALLSVARHDRPLAGEAARARAAQADDAVSARWLQALLECRPGLSLPEARLTVAAVLGVVYSPAHTVSPLRPVQRAALLSGGVVAALLGDDRRRPTGRVVKGRTAGGGRSGG
jgi:AcrR family transcriptional regulator